MTMEPGHHLRLSSPRILDVDVSWGPSDQAHVNWFVNYAPEREEGTDERVLFATLHVVGTTCRGNVQVAATVGESTDFEDWTSFENALAASDALDTLYVFALSGLRTAFSLVGGMAEVPESSPEPEFDRLVPADETDSGQASASDSTDNTP